MGWQWCSAVSKACQRFCVKKVQQKLLDSQTFRECLDMAPPETQRPRDRHPTASEKALKSVHIQWCNGAMLQLSTGLTFLGSPLIRNAADVVLWSSILLQRISTFETLSPCFFLFKESEANPGLGHRLLQLQAL